MGLGKKDYNCCWSIHAFTSELWLSRTRPGRWGPTCLLCAMTDSRACAYHERIPRDLPAGQLCWDLMRPALAEALAQTSRGGVDLEAPWRGEWYHSLEPWILGTEIDAQMANRCRPHRLSSSAGSQMCVAARPGESGSLRQGLPVTILMVRMFGISDHFWRLTQGCL
jgi:hypothetical protein